MFLDKTNDKSRPSKEERRPKLVNEKFNTKDKLHTASTTLPEEKFNKVSKNILEKLAMISEVSN